MLMLLAQEESILSRHLQSPELERSNNNYEYV